MTETRFASELLALIDRCLAEGMAPADLATEMQEQVNIFVGQHNLEYELMLRPRKAA